jgi:hypothetical protein
MFTTRQLRVLVATSVGQGLRSNDYCHTIEGELVLFAPECDDDRDDVDGRCGCRRGMSGATTHRATTTFRVSALEITIGEYRDAIRDSMARSGWIDLDHEEDEDDVDEMMDELLIVAAHYPVGAVLEKRGDQVQLRTIRASA